MLCASVRPCLGGKWFSIALALGVLALSSPVEALNVQYDLGGNIEGRRMEIDKLRAQGTPVRIEGTCVSACTLYLGLPTTCVVETAALGFHGPSSQFPGYKLPKKDFERISRQMAEYYPKKLRRWFLDTGRHILGEYYLLSGAEVIKMGARRC